MVLVAATASDMAGETLDGLSAMQPRDDPLRNDATKRLDQQVIIPSSLLRLPKHGRDCAPEAMTRSLQENM